MFTRGFDFFMSAVCFVLAVVFFMGKGKGILESFGGAQRNRKRTPEEEKVYERGFGIFCLVLAAGQRMMGVVQADWTAWASLVIAFGDLVFIGWYIKNH